jgi:hypothetical protein
MVTTSPRLAILTLLSLVAIGCEGEAATQPTRWTVWVAADAPWAIQESADDVASRLEQMGREVDRGEGAPPGLCERGRGHVLFVGDGIDGAPIEGATDQTWQIEETRCEAAGSRVELSGGGLLGRQYAAYEWLHRLGARFFHPEEQYVPDEPRWPEEALSITHTPAFRWRSVSLHLTHPLELGDAFRSEEDTFHPEAARYIDWQLQNGASRGHAGVGTAEHATRGLDRGYLLETGFSLHNQQQGGRPLIDPDDPRSFEEQIQEAIEAQMNRADGRVPDVLGFSFNPSEFTEIDDRDALRQITFIADYMGEHYPETRVETINHGTAGEPTEHFGIRYYDLPALAPANLGVKVHTLMFYDLFRPAPVYGNESFRNLYDFMAENHTTRHLTHFPESAWWLTFDNAVPLYLPITVEARDRDIQGMRWMLDGLLDGHHVFGSGHEWGYWQNEYCSFRMAADLDYRWQDCFRDITGTMGDAGPEVQSVLEETVAQQEREIIYGEVLAYLVGTDPETEVAASIGIDFHPLPPSPSAILRWDEARVATFERRTRPALEHMDADYASFAARLDAVEASVPSNASSFFREIRDGIAITGLRARHAWQVYGALVMLRRSQLTGDPIVRADAQALLDAARLTTTAALAVIGRREADYRYLPLDRSIAGGPSGTEDDNWTIYHYRYLNRTHHAYYYARIDGLAADAFDGGAEPVEISDALLAPTETIEVAIVDPTLTDATIDWGDGTPPEMATTRASHAYPTVEVYPLAITARLGGEDFALGGDVASLATEWRTGFSGDVLEPVGVDLIEGVMPALTFGALDATRAAIGFSAVAEGTVRLDAWSVATPLSTTDALLETEPAELYVPVVQRSTGTVSSRLLVHDAVLRLETDGVTVTIAGALDTAAVVDAVVAIGGFDRVGATRVVASTLGFTPDTLPEQVDFRVAYTVEATTGP